MKDLCMECKNFKICKCGEGKKLSPKIKVKEVKDTGYFEVIDCNLFKK